MDSGRPREAAAANGATSVAWPAGKVCLACYNAGWVKDGNELVKCPQCHGVSIVERNSKANIQAWLARDHAETARIRASLGLPPLGEEVVDVRPKTPEAPPEGFAATGQPVPNTEREDQMQAARVKVHREIARLAAKMKAEAR